MLISQQNTYFVNKIGVFCWQNRIPSQQNIFCQQNGGILLTNILLTVVFCWGGVNGLAPPWCNPVFWFLILVWFHSVPNCRVQHGIHFDFNHFDFSICTHVLWSVIISISKIDNRWFLIPMLLILYHFDSHTRPWMMGLRRRRINSAFSHF